MPRPGVDIALLDDLVQAGPQFDPGKAFFLGATERGPAVASVHSQNEYKAKFGQRTGGPVLYDDISAFFAEGGSNAVVSRHYGPTSVQASIAFGTIGTFKAVTGGTWGNTIKVTAQTPAGAVTGGTAGQPIRLSIEWPAGTVWEISPQLNNVDELNSWVNNYSNFVNFTLGAGTQLPVAGTAVTLAGGTDVAAVVGDYDTTIGRFTYDMGFGQHVMPGVTDPTVHQKLGVHLDNMDRVGIIDLPDTSDSTAQIASRANLDGKTGARQMLAMGNWVEYPGDTPPATVIIPYSGIQAGIIARADRQGDPSIAAAGADGISRRAVGLSPNGKLFTDAQRTSMNSNGITLGRQMFGLLRTYGYRSAAGPDIRNNWTFFQEARVIMQIAHLGNDAVEEYVFDTIDGKGHLFSQVKNVLTGICQTYWLAGALYGNTPAEGFRVICDSSTNTIDTIRAGEIHASIYLKTSKTAEWIQINIIKVPIEKQV